MKNILFLEQFSSLGGGQRMLLQLLKGLDRSTFNPSVIIPAEGELTKELTKLGVKYYCLPMATLTLGRKNIFDLISYFYNSIFLAIAAVKIIRREKIDLLYAKAPRTFLWGTLAAKICRRPIVWQLHSIFRGLELKAALLAAKLGAARLIADSLAAAAPFKALQPKVRVVYNGIETALYTVPQDKALAKADWQLTSGQPMFGYVGRITRLKGLTDYIEAAAEVAKAVPDAVFFIVGRVMFGGAAEEAYFDSLKKLIEKLGLTGRVKFLGFVADLPRFYAALDSLVLPSIEPEAGPLVVLEAMAAGKVVITTDNGGQAEVITDGESGYLYQAGDRQKLAAKMIEACTDQEKSRRLGEAARAKALRDHNLEQYRANILRVLREVI
ncbi:MAG: glycosyltransferase family 4 protein [Candidatus Margulisiibacteriota bacterium]|jgi:glycosyltransferase involved in cell wall biosynthesis